MTESNGSPSVPYSTKELFAEILKKLASLEGLISKKADAEDVLQLKQEVKLIADRTLVLETQRDDKRDWKIIYLPSIASIVAAIVVVWATVVR